MPCRPVTWVSFAESMLCWQHAFQLLTCEWVSQVSNSQTPLLPAELDHLRARLGACLSKSPPVPSNATAPKTAPDAPARDATPPAAASPPPKTPDKTAAAKKSKADAEPVVPVLSTVEGQMAELGKWNSILSLDTGFVVQDAACADWLAGLLRFVTGPGTM